MTSTAEDLVYVFHKDVLYTLVQSTKWEWSYFGGPFEGEITGIELGPKPLHHIATIVPRELGGAKPYGHHIPLMYGMCFDGCEITYRYDDDKIDIMEARTTVSCDDWPYRNYPDLLPYLQLKVGSDEPCTWDQFGERFTNHDEVQPSEIVAVVPPPKHIGMLLWDHGAGLDGVEIVFECDLKDRIIKASNHCT